MFALKLQQKIVGLLALYFVVALLVIGSTLYVSWRLEGVDTTVNSVSRERARLYHIAFLLALQTDQPSLPEPQKVADLQLAIEDEIMQFETVLSNLDQLPTPHSYAIFHDKEIHEQIGQLRQFWDAEIKPDIRHLLDAVKREKKGKLLADFQPALQSFIGRADKLIQTAGHNNAHLDNLLHYFQIGLAVSALIGTMLLGYLLTRIVVHPITRLRDGIQRMGMADFKVRLPTRGRDEFCELAEGFNQMATKLEGIYTAQVQRIEEKTRSLEDKNHELTALYDIAVFLNSSTPTEPLCGIVLDKLSALVGANDGLVRLIDHSGKQMKIVATSGVEASILTEENCLTAGSCLCGDVTHNGTTVNSDFSTLGNSVQSYPCSGSGYKSVVAIQICSKQRIRGMLNLFFNKPRILPPSEIRLLEAVGQQLGIAIEIQRLVAREKEMAVSEERNLLAQELHDSIAQSLAFLNIEVQMLHDDLQQRKIASALEGTGRIREGLQESYDYVRELLVHFRTRTGHADMETTIRNTLKKFEGQTCIQTHFSCCGTVPESTPQQIIQVMHIVQESLSNIRKHAQASHVEVKLNCNGARSISIHDDGSGFDTSADKGSSHMGLSIMRERAHRIDASLTIESAPGRGTQVCLVMPYREEASV